MEVKEVDESLVMSSGLDDNKDIAICDMCGYEQELRPDEGYPPDGWVVLTIERAVDKDDVLLEKIIVLCPSCYERLKEFLETEKA